MENKSDTKIEKDNNGISINDLPDNTYVKKPSVILGKNSQDIKTEKPSIILKKREMKMSKFIKEPDLDEEDDIDELDKNLLEETEDENAVIKKTVAGSKSSAFFVNTSEQLKNYFKQNKKQVLLLYSIMTALFTVFLSLVIVFTVIYNGKYQQYKKINAELTELQSELAAINAAYFEEVLKNPSIYKLIDSGAFKDNALFSYTVAVQYGNRRDVFQKVSEYDYMGKTVLLPAASNGTFTVEIIESYTPYARSKFSLATLKSYSRFLSPFVADDGSDNEWMLKDYRTIVDLENISMTDSYSGVSEDGTKNLSVLGNITENGNSYHLTFHNFVEKDGLIPHISLRFKEDKEKLTSEEEIEARFSGFFLANIDNSFDELSEILSILGENVALQDIYDNLASAPTYSVFNKLLISMQTFVTAHIKGEQIDGLVSGETLYYLNKLKKGESFGALGIVAKEHLSNFIDNLTGIRNLDEITDDDGIIVLQPGEQLTNHQAAALLDKAFDFKLPITAEDKTTLNSLRNLDLNDYSLTDDGRNMVDRLLALYEKDRVIEISDALYKLQSLVRPINFNRKMNFGEISIRLNV